MAYSGMGWMPGSSSTIGFYGGSLHQARLEHLLRQQQSNTRVVLSGNYSEAAQILRVMPATVSEIDQIKALKARFEGPPSVGLWRLPVNPDAALAAFRALLLHLNDGLRSPSESVVLLDAGHIGGVARMTLVGELIYSVSVVASTGFTVNDFRFNWSPTPEERGFDRVHDLVCGHVFRPQARDRSRSVHYPQLAGKPAAWVIEAMRLSLAAVEAGAWLYVAGLESPAAVMYTRPVIGLDENNALHAERGPAIHWPDMPDMPTVYCSHGVEMAKTLVMEPEKITADMVTNQPNAEQRREMMRLIGYERYVREGGFALVSDAAREFGNAPPKGLLNAKLWRKVWREAGPNAGRLNERFSSATPEQATVLLELQNSSKESDGTYKTYFLRVPPQMRKVAEAAAWTFAVGNQEYLELAAET